MTTLKQNCGMTQKIFTKLYPVQCAMLIVHCIFHADWGGVSHDKYKKTFNVNSCLVL